MEEKIIVLFTSDASLRGAFKLCCVCFGDESINAVMDAQRDAGLNVAQELSPIFPYQEGLELHWEPFQEDPEEQLPSMLYNVTADNGQFVRQFRAVAVPISGTDISFTVSRDNRAQLFERLPEWAR